MPGFNHKTVLDFLRVKREPEFEKLRQAQETRNETIINYIQILVFGNNLAANIGTLFFPLASYRARPVLIEFLVAGLLFRIAIFFYLRRPPAYHPARKYVIATLDLMTYTIPPVLLGLQGAYPWLVVNLFTLTSYTILIALSGLRYSKRVAIYTGTIAFGLHLLLFPMLPANLMATVALVGAQTVGFVTLCVTFSTASLIRIHREAAAKENLARFLPAELVEQVMLDPKLLERSTERRNATVTRSSATR